MTNPFVYILLNGELKMSPGKAAAQSVHALAALDNEEGIKAFSGSVKRTVIVLEAKNGHQLDNLDQYLYDLGIPAACYIDEGHNEVMPYSVTALAVGPIAHDDEEKRSIFESFSLYGGHITVKRTGDLGWTEEQVIVPNNLELASKFAFRKLKKAAE